MATLNLLYRTILMSTFLFSLVQIGNSNRGDPESGLHVVVVTDFQGGGCSGL